MKIQIKNSYKMRHAQMKKRMEFVNDEIRKKSINHQLRKFRKKISKYKKKKKKEEPNT